FLVPRNDNILNKYPSIFKDKLVFFFAAVAYFLSIKIALYSMITYLAASKTLDFIVEGGGMIRKRPLEQ
ncbi:YitT family protein, partial [Flavobacterium psychrophilum]|uniref:YitT family protein n=1 Tax=Flavobacterium psychrophilum TaxID=96345 RepID=UPI00117ADC46